MSDLKELHLPEGYAVHDGNGCDPAAWEAIVEGAFDAHADFADKIARPGMCPERLWFVSINGRDVATAMSYDHPDYPGEGFLHMVAADPAQKGKGAGAIAVRAVLLDLFRRGKTGCVLTTDDERLPALHVYLKLGFVPVIEDDEMRERWERVFAKLGEN